MGLSVVKSTSVKLVVAVRFEIAHVLNGIAQRVLPRAEALRAIVDVEALRPARGNAQEQRRGPVGLGGGGRAGLLDDEVVEPHLRRLAIGVRRRHERRDYVERLRVRVPHLVNRVEGHCVGGIPQEAQPPIVELQVRLDVGRVRRKRRLGSRGAERRRPLHERTAPALFDHADVARRNVRAQENAAAKDEPPHGGHYKDEPDGKETLDRHGSPPLSVTKRRTRRSP